MLIVRNLLLPAREPSLLLTRAVLRFSSGDNPANCASKIHACTAFDQTSPIALATAPKLDAVTSVSLAQSKRRRSRKQIIENPNLERNL